ncbi:unnamed protein product [Linum tenue]|uniref:Uncharacterized protein n=1 Tax=Linum tenue TaxID=586396 RepID=A0AAV0LGF1_9ROSI|nr:unnamed protein product [Linum tenue]
MKYRSLKINTTSIAAYTRKNERVAYSSTKGAIVNVMRSLSSKLVGRGIQVNEIVRISFWTSLHVLMMPPERMTTLECEVSMKRAGTIYEIIPSFVFLASRDCSSNVFGIGMVNTCMFGGR